MGDQPKPIICDAGALIAIERRTGLIRRTVEAATSAGRTLVVPGPVLAQVWRGGARQALLARFLGLPSVEIDLLSRSAWLKAGEVCGRSRTADVVDAAVIVCARERGAYAVVTSDPDDLRRLDPGLAYWSPV